MSEIEDAVEEEEKQAEPPAEGEYRGWSPLWYWGSGLAVFLMIPIVRIVFPWLDAHGVRSRGAAPSLTTLALWCSVAVVLWLYRVRYLARAVTWDGQGLEVTWYRGEPKRFAWDELQREQGLALNRTTSGISVTASDGTKFGALEGCQQYDELTAVIEAHMPEDEMEP